MICWYLSDDGSWSSKPSVCVYGQTDRQGKINEEEAEIYLFLFIYRTEDPTSSGFKLFGFGSPYLFDFGFISTTNKWGASLSTALYKPGMYFCLLLYIYLCVFVWNLYTCLGGIAINICLCMCYSCYRSHSVYLGVHSFLLR